MGFLAWLDSALVLLLLSYLSVAVLYLLLLAFSGWTAREKAREAVFPQKRFAILIPAHNEEKVLGQCLESIQNQNYYNNLYQVYVIADNCSDKTTELARKHPVQVLERSDTSRPGKGYALAWGLEKIKLDDYDALVIVDADCLLQENLLLAFNRRLLGGQLVLQAYDGIYNIQQSFLTYLLYLGNLVENHLFYAGRQVLGLTTFLRGTGMCFSTRVLRKYGWHSFSETEDLEFSLRLLEDGFKIDFVPESKVLAIQPSQLKTAYSQKRRWAGGTFQIIRKNLLRLIKRGFTSGRLEFLEAAFSLTLLSRPVLIYVNLVGILLILILPAGLRSDLLWWGLSLLLVQILYLSLSVLLAENRVRALKTLVVAPFYLLWLLAVQLLSLGGARKQVWQKTTRENA